MTDPDQPACDTIAQLVRHDLDRRIAEVDASSLVARVCAAALETPTASQPRANRRSGPPGRGGWHRAAGWLAVSALAAVLAFFGGRQFAPGTASAAPLLRDVQSAHREGDDRCYRVQYAPDPRYWDRTKPLDGPSESVLWTRSTAFWADCTIGTVRLAIGRDESGQLWCAPSRQSGIRFARGAAEPSDEVALICALNSMSVPTLVDDVLADFELRVEPPASHASGTTTVIWAALKEGRTNPLISSAVLEVDSRTDVVVRLVLWTTRQGRPGGTVTYTLIDSDRLDDEQYRLESHLDDAAQIEVHPIPPRKPKTPPTAS